jgi:uncharacterized membrane protein YhaH (DUF805 family)
VRLAIAGLLGSALALGIAPLVMPDDYRWVANTTSESAAQGVPGAWLARLGLLLFGCSVLLIVMHRRPYWPRPAAWSLLAFAGFLVASAVFSTRSWRPDATVDPTEDLLHSVAATAMGFAFAAGLLSLLVLAPRITGTVRRALTITAIGASVVLPTAMWLWPGAQGLFQRTMFALAYLWFAMEARAPSRDLTCRA